MKRRHLILAAGLAAAAALATLGQSTAPTIEVAEPLARRAAPVHAGAAAPSQPLHLLAREQLYGGATGDAAFASEDFTPPPPAPAAKALAPPAPSAPALPFTFLGKSYGDGHWEVFLARGEQVHVVRQQTQIDANYRVESIAPPVLTLTYLPLNQVQQINIGVLD